MAFNKMVIFALVVATAALVSAAPPSNDKTTSEETISPAVPAAGNEEALKSSETVGFVYGLPYYRYRYSYIHHYPYIIW